MAKITLSGIKHSYLPNPTTDDVHLELGRISEEITIEITNVHGQLLRSSHFENVDKINLNIEEAPGLYFLNVRTSVGSGTFRIVKE